MNRMPASRRGLAVAMLFPLVLLASCKPQTPPTPDGQAGGAASTAGQAMSTPTGTPDAMKQGTMPVTGKTGSAMAKTTTGAPAASEGYVAYRDGVIGNGQSSVLFFHASWCPSCKKADALLNQWYANKTSRPTRTVYKIDYDTHTNEKRLFNVTYQHTLILIDEEGNVIKKINGPTEAELAELVGKI